MVCGNPDQALIRSIAYEHQSFCPAFMAVVVQIGLGILAIISLGQPLLPIPKSVSSDGMSGPDLPKGFSR